MGLSPIWSDKSNDEMSLAFGAGVLVILFGVYLLTHAITSYKTAVASLSWPTTKANVVDVYLWGKRNIDGVMLDAEKLAVEYRYGVGGVDYTGRSATFYTLLYPKTMELYDRLQSSTDTLVYYNPSSPSESVLVPGLNPDKPYSDLILGCITIFVGVAVAVFSWLGVIG